MAIKHKIKRNTYDLRSLAMRLSAGRRTGKTYQLAEATKNLNGVMLCATEQQARDIKKHLGIRTANAGDPKKLLGLTGPFIADHFLIECLLHNTQDYISELETQLALRGVEFE